MTTTNRYVHRISLVILFMMCLLDLCSKSSAQKAQQCVMYGQCGEGDYGTLNCLANSPPKVIDDVESIELLKQICPEYVKDDKALTCCDESQIAQLDANFKLPQRLLSRCPACFANFRKNFCKLTCSPTQSDYIMATRTEKNEEGKEMVNELVYFINQKYVEGLFDSCRRVEGIIPGTRVIDLMCGRHGPKCTGPDWLEFMGSTPDNSGFSPFQINYTISDSDKVDINGSMYFPMNESTHRCFEPVEPGQSACACSDCAEACNKPETEAPATTVASVDSGTTVLNNADSKSKVDATNNAKNEETRKSEQVKDGDSSAEDEEKLRLPRFKLMDHRLFRRILSPLIVIAPAFADN